VKIRTVASGVAALTLAGLAVPAALTGSASATTTLTPTITACKPAPATLGKTLTIEGTGLKGATAVEIGKVSFEAPFKADSRTKIKVALPKKIKGVKNGPGNVTVTGATSTIVSNSFSCTFQKAPAKNHKK
jgi:hypothetical protein